MEFDEQIIAESKAMSFSQAAGNSQNILDFILSKPDKLLLQAMETRIRKPAAGEALMDYSRALFLVLGPSARRSDSSRSASLLLRLVIKLLDVVQKIRVSEDRKIMDCLDLILQELDALPRKSLPHVVEVILQKMENPTFASNSDADDGIILQLLPRCFSLIAASSHVVEAPGPNQSVSLIACSDYTDHLLKRMLSTSPWSKSVLMKIVSMLRDMPLNEGHLVEFLNTIFGQMKNVEPVDFPALVYQLLLLASKGSKRVILFGILSFFSWSLSASSEILKTQKIGKKSFAESCRQVEGTILLHINFAVKQNPALGQEILFLVRTRSLPLNSFIISVILSLARIQRFEEPAMNLLKAAVTKSYQDWKLSRCSSCAPSPLKKQCLEDIETLEQSFMKTVRNTAFGCDHVVPSLVSFGFILVELQPGDSSFCDPAKPFQSSGCRDLGAIILRTTFEVHELARDEIIEQSKCRIIGLKPEQSSPVIKMIGLLVQDYPHLMLEHVSRLKECLDYYTFLHPTSAAFLIHSIGSLLQLSSDLQGYAVLVLRKAMFGRETTARINALQGLINLLIADRATKAHSGVDSFLYSSSEASCSQQEHGYFRRTPSLLQELQGLLRRCFLQQAKIRELLYKGLIKLVLVDPTAADIAFNLLWPHFCRYFKTTEDSDITLDMSCCVKIQNNSAVMEEPLDHLIFAVHNLLTLQPHEEEGHNTCSETCFDFSLSQDQEIGRMSAAYSLKDAFLKLRKKFVHNPLSDLNIDKFQNFTLETVEGKSNLEKANIYFGVYEILIDSLVSQITKCQRGSKVDEAEKNLQLCVSTYLAIEEILQKNANASGSKLRPSVEPSAQFGPSAKSQSGFGQSFDKKLPFLSAANTVYLLQYAQKPAGEVIPPKNTASTSQSDGALKDMMGYRYKLAFLSIRACLRHVKAAAHVNGSQDEDPSGIKRLGGDWKVLGKPVLEALTAALTLSSGVFSWSVEKKEREKQGRGRRPSDEVREGLILILVKCLEEICRLAIKKNCIMEVFGQANLQVEGLVQEKESRANESVHLTSQQLFIQEIMLKKVQPLLEQLLHRSQFREFEVLSGVMLCLGSKLQPNQTKHFGSWAESNCKSLKVTYNGAAKALLKLCMCLIPPPDDLILAQTLSQELLKVIGTDEQEPIEISGMFHTVNTSTKNCIAGLLLQHLETVLNDAEWLITKLKLYPSTKFSDLLDVQPQPHFETSRLESEIALHKRLESIVVVLSNFVQMSSSGAVAEHSLKVAVKLYKCLAAATKLCIAPKGFKQTIPSIKFQLLTEVTCKRLTAPLYTFMAVMQRDQQENCPTRGAKGAVNKIKREVRTIPNLVFHVEDYERYLIQLSRLTKVNFLRHAKRSTARDFKILENGKKCKQPNNIENTREEAAVADGAEESEKEADSQEEQNSEQEQNGSQEDASIENENNEEQAQSIRFRRPMEKRGRKSVVQDSDDEAEGNKRQRG